MKNYAANFLGKIVLIKIDRPINSKHPKHGFVYEVNYGFVPNTKAPDGEEIDAYLLCVSEPVEEFTGKCIAVIHRKDNDDDKLVIVPENFRETSDEEISKAVNFQEKWFKYIIVRELKKKDEFAKKLPYRKNVGALVFKNNKYLLIQIADWPDSFWKLPQGGIKDGETKEETIMRELKEELGTDKFKIIKQFPHKHQYDWDEESVKHAGYNWRGQKQSFFLVEFTGNYDEITIDKKELKDCCWVKESEVLKKIDTNHPLFKGYRKLVEKLLKAN